MENMDLFTQLLNSSTIGVLEGTFRSNLKISELKKGVRVIKEYNYGEIIFARNPSGLLGILKFPELLSIEMVNKKNQQATLHVAGVYIFLQFIGDSCTGTFYGYESNFKDIRDKIKEK